MGSSIEDPYAFIPEIHLAPLEKPVQRVELAELGFDPTIYSSIAASCVTPLFTLEAVRRIRAEILDHDTLANYIYNAWTHPEVVKRVNRMAGIPLTPVYNFVGTSNSDLGVGQDLNLSHPFAPSTASMRRTRNYPTRKYGICHGTKILTL